jgi:hypothetical protein
MTKQSRNVLLLVGAAIVLLLVGGYIYVKQKDSGAPQPGPSVDQDCRTFADNQSCTKDYIGLIESDAVSKANSLKQPYRIVQREDQTFPVTQDLNNDRLNFTIKDGVVTRAEFY